MGFLLKWFEFGELINLGADCLVFVFLVVYFRLTESRYRILLIPVALLSLSHLFTVVEGLGFPLLFNLLEHIMLLLSVFASSLVVYRIFREQTQ